MKCKPKTYIKYNYNIVHTHINLRIILILFNDISRYRTVPNIILYTRM